MSMKLLKNISLFTVLISSPLCASAFTWGNPVTIIGIYVYADGHAFIRTSGNQNPDSCASPGYLMISKDSINFGKLYATALTANTTGTTVSINYDGCSTVGGSYPIVNSIAVPNAW